MKIGFTGTREGMNTHQLKHFYRFIAELPEFTEFHHGACVGADEEAAQVVIEMDPCDGTRDWKVVAHPCDILDMVSLVAKAAYSDFQRLPKPPLDRNHDIVDACDVLLACPKGPEEMRSGTWATVRYARKQSKRVVIFWPDGRVEG